VPVVSVRCMYRDFLRLRRLIRRSGGGIELGIVALEWIQEPSWRRLAHHVPVISRMTVFFVAFAISRFEGK
jgi:hypothetical protein